MRTLKPKSWAAIACIALLFSCQKNNEEPPLPESKIYASSNTEGIITVFDVSELDEAEEDTFAVAYTDADGIYYESETDVLFQLDRSNNQVKAYQGFSTKETGAMLSPGLVSSVPAGVPAIFANGRGMAKSGGKIVVAVDADSLAGTANAFFVYTLTGNAIEFTSIYLSPFHLWGIHLEGSTLYAVQDNSDTLAVFHDFFAHANGSFVQPSMKVQIEGIVRTHGITYHKASDRMFLTDIGDAASDKDGAFHIIHGFSGKLSAAGNRGSIAASQQTRISGFNTYLGNPVDVAYEENNDLIFIAERANGGGRVLGFEGTVEGNAIPEFNQRLDGASAVHVYSE